MSYTQGRDSSSSTGAPVNHSALTGLGNDDHPQYLTQARGDNSYPSKDLATTTTNGLQSFNNFNKQSLQPSYPSKTYGNLSALSGILNRIAQNDPVAILAFGDSIIEGSGTSARTGASQPSTGSGSTELPTATSDYGHLGGSFTQTTVAQNILRSYFGNNTFRIYNAGQGGQQMATGWPNLRFDTIKNNPTYTVPIAAAFHNFATNDLQNGFASLTDYRTQIKIWCDKCWAANIIPGLYIPLDFPNSIRGNGTGYKNSRVAEYRQAAIEETLGRGGFIIDLNSTYSRTIFGNGGQNLSWRQLVNFEANQVHPNDFGHSFLGGLLAASLLGPDRTLQLNGSRQRVNFADPETRWPLDENEAGYSTYWTLTNIAQQGFAQPIIIPRSSPVVSLSQPMIDMYVNNTSGKTYSLYYHPVGNAGYTATASASARPVIQVHSWPGKPTANSITPVLDSFALTVVSSTTNTVTVTGGAGTTDRFVGCKLAVTVRGGVPLLIPEIYDVTTNTSGQVYTIATTFTSALSAGDRLVVYRPDIMTNANSAWSGEYSSQVPGAGLTTPGVFRLSPGYITEIPLGLSRVRVLAGSASAMAIQHLGWLEFDTIADNSIVQGIDTSIPSGSLLPLEQFSLLGKVGSSITSKVAGPTGTITFPTQPVISIQPREFARPAALDSSIRNKKTRLIIDAGLDPDTGVILASPSYAAYVGTIGTGSTTTNIVLDATQFPPITNLGSWTLRFLTGSLAGLDSSVTSLTSGAPPSATVSSTGTAPSSGDFYLLQRTGTASSLFDGSLVLYRPLTGNVLQLRTYRWGGFNDTGNVPSVNSPQIGTDLTKVWPATATIIMDFARNNNATAEWTLDVWIDPSDGIPVTSPNLALTGVGNTTAMCPPLSISGIGLFFGQSVQNTTRSAFISRAIAQRLI